MSEYLVHEITKMDYYLNVIWAVKNFSETLAKTGYKNVFVLRYNPSENTSKCYIVTESDLPSDIVANIKKLGMDIAASGDDYWD